MTKKETFAGLRGGMKKRNRKANAFQAAVGSEYKGDESKHRKGRGLNTFAEIEGNEYKRKRSKRIKV
jgi:hypothetical protein